VRPSGEGLGCKLARLVLCTALVLGGAAVLPDAPALAATIPAQDVTVRVKRIDHFSIGRSGDRHGPLTFLGGLEILSGNRNLGGLSGLIVSDDGARMLAITDNALWVEGNIVSDAGGRPTNLRDVRISPMIGPNGIPLLDQNRGDTEAVTLDRRAGKLLVSVERVHEIYSFPWPFDGEARGQRVSLPAEIGNLRSNKGMEAIAAASTGPLAGTLVIIAERGHDNAADMPGFLIGGPRPGTFTVAREASYDATDLAMLPNGDALLLERRFTLRHGIGMRLRLLPASELVPGGRAVGTVLIEGGFTDQIDNMEGLAVHRDAEGNTVLTVVSDDNRSILQRTLLLRFRLDLP
jgi:hypothetical protein